MSALAWGIKTSLLAYVRGMPDGRIEVSTGASEDASGRFLFPAADSSDDTRRFRGTVTLSGHDGMMRIVVTDPWLVPAASGHLLTIADEQSPTGRLDFAAVTADDTLLTADGADLFFGPYVEGTVLDRPVLID